MADPARRDLRVAHRPVAGRRQGRSSPGANGRRPCSRPALEPGLEWVASTLSAATLLTELKESSRRISELVKAVSSYSQMDRASMQHIDMTTASRAPSRCSRTSSATGSPWCASTALTSPVEAHAGELNQVWTNLIDNAIDAMDGAGTLRIVTPADGDNVASSRDTGPGMSPEVVARAFEAFYTTKDVGKGAGLGLDTARRIIEEHHGGTITITRSPARPCCGSASPSGCPGTRGERAADPSTTAGQGVLPAVADPDVLAGYPRVGQRGDVVRDREAEREQHLDRGALTRLHSPVQEPLRVGRGVLPGEMNSSPRVSRRTPSISSPARGCRRRRNRGSTGRPSSSPAMLSR